MHHRTHVKRHSETMLGCNAEGSNAQAPLQCWTHRRTHVTQRGEAVLGSNAGESNAQVSLQCWMHRRTHVTQRGEAMLGCNVGGGLTSVTVQEIKPKNDNVISDGEKLARGMSKGNLHRRNRLNRSVFPSDQRFQRYSPLLVVTGGTPSWDIPCTLPACAPWRTVSEYV